MSPDDLGTHNPFYKTTPLIGHRNSNWSFLKYSVSLTVLRIVLLPSLQHGFSIDCVLPILRCLGVLWLFCDVVTFSDISLTSHPSGHAAPAVKNLRLAAFGPRLVTPTDSCVRVYVVDDTRAALDVSDRELARLRCGQTLM